MANNNTPSSTANNPTYKTKAIIISTLVVFLAALAILLTLLWILRERKRKKNQQHRAWPALESMQQPAELHNENLSSKHPVVFEMSAEPTQQQPAELHNKSLSQNQKRCLIFEMSTDTQIVELPGSEVPIHHELE